MEQVVRPAVPVAGDLFDEHLRELVSEGARTFAELSKKVVADPERAQRVAAMEAAMEHALLLGEIRERRSLSQNDVAVAARSVNISKSESSGSAPFWTTAEVSAAARAQ